MKYSCGGCGEVFETEEAAIQCCGESAEQSSDCCEAPIVTGTKRSYPLGESAFYVWEDFDINVCEKCHHEVDCA